MDKDKYCGKIIKRHQVPATFETTTFTFTSYSSPVSYTWHVCTLGYDGCVHGMKNFRNVKNGVKTSNQHNPMQNLDTRKHDHRRSYVTRREGTPSHEKQDNAKSACDNCEKLPSSCGISGLVPSGVYRNIILNGSIQLYMQATRQQLSCLDNNVLTFSTASGV